MGLLLVLILKVKKLSELRVDLLRLLLALSHLFLHDEFVVEEGARFTIEEGAFRHVEKVRVPDVRDVEREPHLRFLALGHQRGLRPWHFGHLRHEIELRFFRCKYHFGLILVKVCWNFSLNRLFRFLLWKWLNRFG